MTRMLSLTISELLSKHGPYADRERSSPLRWVLRAAAAPGESAGVSGARCAGNGRCTTAASRFPKATQDGGQAGGTSRAREGG